MKKAFVIILFALSLAACKKETDVALPEERPFTRDFYLQGYWAEQPFPDTIFFDYTVGRPPEAQFGNLLFCYSISRNIDGYKTIEALFDSGSQEHYFRFRSPFPATGSDGEPWTRAELLALIQPGKTFEVTGAPGQAELGISRPSSLISSLFSSTESSTPGGSITLLAVEDYRWTVTRYDGSIVENTGLKVRIQFEAFVGVNNGKLNAAVFDGEASILLGYI